MVADKMLNQKIILLCNVNGQERSLLRTLKKIEVLKG